jgi:hypothetical protein
MEITVLVLSGQRLEADGNGMQQAYFLVPSDNNSVVVLNNNGCRNELDEVRSEAVSGVLETCTAILGNPASSAVRGQVSLTFDRQYLTNELIFSVSAEDGNGRLSVTSTYQSYDGFTQTLLPFDDIPEGFNGTGTALSSVARFRLELLNDIYERLVQKLGVPEADQTENFPEGRASGIGEGNKYFAASFEGTFGQVRVINDTLSNIILGSFTLESQLDKKLVSFEVKRGLYGPERGGGAKLRQSNIVANWVWLLLIFLLATVAFIFDRINDVDANFFLFQAFVEVNKMDCIAGPLALDDSKEFRLAKFQGMSDDIGHLGFNPADPTQLEVEAFQAVRDVKGPPGVYKYA